MALTGSHELSKFEDGAQMEIARILIIVVLITMLLVLLNALIA